MGGEAVRDVSPTGHAEPRHHAEVAALAGPEQDFWLRKAEEHRWPVKYLRRQVRANLAQRSAEPLDGSGQDPDRGYWVILSLQIRTSPVQLANWPAVAERANLGIEAWPVLALEQAAWHELGTRELGRKTANTANEGGTMQIRTNEDVILDLFSAIEEHDLERVFAIYHPEVEFHWPTALPYGGSHTGLGEPGTPTWRDSWLPLQPTAAERSLDGRVIASRGDEVVAIYHQRGRDRDGNVIDDQVIGLYTLEGGKLRRAQMFYYNLDAVLRFLGASGIPDDSQ